MRGTGGGERLRRARSLRLAKRDWRRRTRRRARAGALKLQEAQDREAARTRDSPTRAGHYLRWYDPSLSTGVAEDGEWERNESQPTR
jgi:hypothetical protein